MQAFEQGLLIGALAGHRLRDCVVLGQESGDFTHAGDDGLENTQFRVKRRLLRHIGQAHARLLPDRTIVERSRPGQHTQQRGFAAAVTSDQRHPLARVKLEIRVIKQGNMAIGQRSVGES